MEKLFGDYPCDAGALAGASWAWAAAGLLPSSLALKFAALSTSSGGKRFFKISRRAAAFGLPCCAAKLYQASAMALLGELLLLPEGLTHKQWVKSAGLDPRHVQSGKSIHKQPRLSKAGNRYIRHALYMSALRAKAHDPYVKAYFEHLIANGKKPLQAVCAVMRTLLHAIHGMLKHHQPFDNTRFYALPT